MANLGSARGVRSAELCSRYPKIKKFCLDGFYLVKYTWDGIYDVVQASHLKFTNTSTKVKYCDGRYYEAIIIGRHPLRNVLVDIAQNLEKRVPIVKLIKYQSSISFNKDVEEDQNLPDSRPEEKHSDEEATQIDIHIQECHKEIENEYQSSISFNKDAEEEAEHLPDSRPEEKHSDEEAIQIDIHVQECHKEIENDYQSSISFKKDTEEDQNLPDSRPEEKRSDEEAIQIDLCMFCGEMFLNLDVHIQECHKEIENISFYKNDDNATKMLHQALNHKIIILDDVNLNIDGYDTLAVDKMCMSGPSDKVLNTKNNENVKAGQKKHCCCYCQKHVFKIYRHYLNVHKKEKEVKEIVVLPPKSTYRQKLLDILRKRGDYIYNTQIKGENQISLVCRETKKSQKSLREKDVPCPHCKGYYSKFSIRHHIRKCVPSVEKNKKRTNIQAECRRLENNIHEIASDDLRNKIFPVLNEDAVTNAIRYDEAVINYANYLCRKYTKAHHAQQIRSNIRALGRFILAIKEINPHIENLNEALDANNIELIVKAIDKVAGLDDTTNLYRAPATAMLLTTELKKLSKILLMEYIKKGDRLGQKRMENLGIIFNVEFQVTVNKKGVETQKINSRRKKTILPKTEQIGQFRNYLENKIEYYIDKLSREFSKEDWTYLAEYTLVHLAVFNRKRPGETQRILIDDYKNYEIVNDNEIGDEIDGLAKEQIKKWARIRLTGKLGKNTALLVHRDLGFKAINLILKYREKAGVSKENIHIFGEPSQFRLQSTFEACSLIRKISAESGIENATLLRTRLLRQHLATETATSAVDDRLEGRVSDFMSHKRHIHQDYYVMTQKTDDITKVSTLLENFSDSKNVNSRRKPFKLEGRSDGESPKEENDLQGSTNSLTNAEVNYALGINRSRRSWTSTEKCTAREYFYDEIHFGTHLLREKVNQFYKLHTDLYKYRNPHLIAQWIKCEQEKILKQDEGIKAKRLRWSTPEKEILRTTTERHSSEGTAPSVSECELLLEQHEALRNRNAQSVKSFIYQGIKKLKDVSS